MDGYLESGAARANATRWLDEAAAEIYGAQVKNDSELEAALDAELARRPPK
jgi:hypothetical protein